MDFLDLVRDFLEDLFREGGLPSLLALRSKAIAEGE
jgi:hypothetical protein